MFIGPHDATTQRAANHYARLRSDGTVPAHVAAGAVARDVLEGRDAMPAALVYDACERDAAWTTADILAGSGYEWAEVDGWTLSGSLTLRLPPSPRADARSVAW